ncbi:MAG: mechanosensitive ion channel [Bacteroidales bacterium]|nr:mechanosensitive ion channel [Bacteroidales bacterium]MDD3891645.1 mechanosensitive ion channel [Bacteroidales bacterium]
MENLTSLIPSTEWLLNFALTYGGKLVLVVVTLIVGYWLIGRLVRMMKRIFEKREFDKTLQTFLVQLVGITLKVLLAISVVTMIGVQMTSFIALLGAAGVAFGMALSGTLQNFAGGVMLLILKPFKVDDYIEAQGFAGTVMEIQIFHTVLNTPDKKRIIIPNGGLSAGSMINYSAEPIRRVNWDFAVAYSEDIDKVKQTVIDVVSADERVLKDPVPFVAVASLGDSSVNLTVRAWVNSPDYWSVFFKMNEAVKNEFDAKGISIPFPQQDVHLFQQK